MATVQRPKASEAQIKRSIMDFLKFIGVSAWPIATTGIPIGTTGKFRTSVNRKGTLDIFFFFKSRGGVIEVKTPKGALRPEQKLALEEVASAGGIAILARSVEDVKHAFEMEGLI